MIDITGCDLKEFVKKAYELSVPQGMGHLHHYTPDVLTDAEAAGLINADPDKRVAVSLDYVRGRAVKMTVFRRDGLLEIHDDWFDHGHEQLATLLTHVGVKR